jgi:hypothetical protein
MTFGLDSIVATLIFDAEINHPRSEKPAVLQRLADAEREVEEDMEDRS